MTVEAAKIEVGEPRLGVLDSLTGYHLRRAVGVFTNDFARSVDGTGMRQQLFAILSVVGANPDIKQGYVASAVGIQKANMVSLVNQLVESELMERRTASEDRRAVALTLTEAGKSMLADCLERIQAHEERTLSALNATERKKLVTLLHKIETRER